MQQGYSSKYRDAIEAMQQQRRDHTFIQFQLQRSYECIRESRRVLALAEQVQKRWERYLIGVNQPW